MFYRCLRFAPKEVLPLKTRIYGKNKRAKLTDLMMPDLYHIPNGEIHLLGTI